MPHKKLRKDERIKRIRRFSTELEFLGEPPQIEPHSLVYRIAGMYQELNDAERSTRALLATARLALA